MNSRTLFSFFFSVLLLLTSSCGPRDFSRPNQTEPESESDRETINEKNTKNFIAIFEDLSQLSAVIDLRGQTEDQAKSATTDGTTLSMHKLLRERLADGFCYTENKTYKDSTVFRLSTLLKAGIPDDQQKKCPIDLNSWSEKKIPTAGVEQWKRTTSLSDNDGKLKHGKSITFNVTSSENSNRVSENTLMLSGVVNLTLKLVGRGERKLSTSGTTIILNFKGDMTLDLGGLNRPKDLVKFSLDTTVRRDGNAFVVDHQRYLLNDKEIEPKKLEKALPIVGKIFNWNWPNDGVK